MSYSHREQLTNRHVMRRQGFPNHMQRAMIFMIHDRQKRYVERISFPGSGTFFNKVHLDSWQNLLGTTDHISLQIALNWNLVAGVEWMRRRELIPHPCFEPTGSRFLTDRELGRVCEFHRRSWNEISFTSFYSAELLTTGRIFSVPNTKNQCMTMRCKSVTFLCFINGIRFC